VLELFRMVDVQHLGTLFCERATDDVSRDHVRRAKDANSAQRPLR
jgi:hypothetical protein